MVLEHVFKGLGRCRFPKIDGFVVSFHVPDNGETAAANAGVVHADHAHAELGAYQRVDGITLPQVSE